MEREYRQNRLIVLLRRIRIQYRLFLIFAFLSLLPVTGLALFAYRIYTDSLNRQIGDSVSEAVKLLGRNLLTEVKTFSDYANTLSVSETVQSVLTVPPGGDTLSDEMNTRRLQTVFDTNLVQSNYLKNIRIVDRNGTILFDLHYSELQQGVAEQLREIDRTSPQDSLQYGGWARNHNTVILGRRLHNLYGENEPIGYFLFSMDEKMISSDVFSGVSFGRGSLILLISSRNRQIIGSSDSSLLDRNFLAEQLSLRLQSEFPRAGGSFNARLGEESYLVVCEYLPDFDEHLTAMIPEQTVKADITRLTSRLVAAGALLFLLSLGSTMAVYFSIIAPIKRMTAYCEKLPGRTGSVTEQLNDRGADELTILADTIDNMVGDLHRLMEQREADAKRKRQLELERLQYQINPHFLFNTLDTLKWISEAHDVPVLTRGIFSLSQLLRNTIMETDEYVSLRQEITALSHYTDIQKIRYADSFSVVWDVDPRAEEVPVPRFTLQPLVENAILHGTYDSGEEIEIRIFCRIKGEFLELKVEDTGQGFHAGEEEAGRESFFGIGLSNVRERLRLHYGSGSDFQLKSLPGRGTVCTIHLPVRRDLREERTS